MTNNYSPPMRIPGDRDSKDIIVMDWGGPFMYYVDKTEPDATAFDFSKNQKGRPDREIFRMSPYQGKKLMLWLMMGALG